MLVTRRMWWGGVLIIIGVLFLLDNLRVVDLGELVRTYWPVLLVLWGASLLRFGGRRHVSVKGGSDVRPHVFGDSTEATASDRIQHSTVFGDVNVKVTSSAFRGGEVSTVFGKSTVDLSGGAPADGEQVVSVRGTFGDAVVLLPAHIAFAVAAESVFGTVTVNDLRKSGVSVSLRHQSPGYDAAAKKIRVEISQIFGEVNVRTV